MSTKIFLSVGRTSTDQQEAFVQAIEHHLESHGLIPQTVGRTYFSSQQPLKAIDELMQQCDGTVIVAYERLYADQLTDRRGHPEAKVLGPAHFPTVWNQIEAAMAYVVGHPLLVITEEGLRNEGLLEPGYDWYVQRIKLDPAALTEAEFVGIFTDWKERVLAFQQQKKGLAPEERPTSQHALAIPDRERLIGLRQILTSRFSEGELRVLCFDLGIDYQDLPGEEKVVKAMELVALLQRHRRLDELTTRGRQLRPDAEWP